MTTPTILSSSADDTRSATLRRKRQAPTISPLFVLAAVGVLAFFFVLLMLVNSALWPPNPYRDSGVFLYVGSEMLHGRVPYRDVWDHKPPCIYFIDALGLALARGSPVGVWALELTAVAVALFFQFVVLTCAFGIVPAVFAIIVFMGSLSLLLPGGNLPEEFALPLQCASLYLFWEAETRSRYSLRWFLLGIAAGLAITLKYNLVGLWIAIGIVCWIRLPLLDTLRRLIRAVAGASVVFALFGIYLICTHAIADWWDQTIRYNIVYSSDATSLMRLQSIVRGMQLLAPSGMSVLCGISWLLVVSYIFRRRHSFSHTDPLTVWLGVALPIELVAATATGRSYDQYYITLLPVQAGLAAYFAFRVSVEGSRVPSRWILTFLVIVMSVVPSYRCAGRLSAAEPVTARDVVLRLIEADSEVSDRVLVWGAETSINFLSQRRAPSRLAYQYALWTAHYASPQMASGFVADLRANPPALIIDTSSTNDLIPPIDAGRRRVWSRQAGRTYLPKAQEIFDFVTYNYQPFAVVRPDGWIVYRSVQPITRDDIVEERRAEH